MDTYNIKRKDERLPYSASLQFTVLCLQESNHQRIKTQGEIIDASKSGLGIMTGFPVEPGHVLMWNDKHQKVKLHIALVKWAKEQDSSYRAG